MCIVDTFITNMLYKICKRELEEMITTTLDASLLVAYCPMVAPYQANYILT